MKQHKDSILRRIALGMKRARGIPLHINLRSEREFVRTVRSIPVKNLTHNELVSYVHKNASVPSHSAQAWQFAALTEIITRQTDQVPFDEQIIAGLLMLDSNAVQMQTGEGKTLAAVFSAVSLAVDGHRCWVMTANEYLAGRDCDWMGDIFRSIGLTIASVSADMDSAQKFEAYRADVCYVTAQQAGFDYLRDCLATEISALVQPDFDCCIVDEADFILIDEARNPLVIASEHSDVHIDYSKYMEIAGSLKQDSDYSCNTYKHICALTLRGRDCFFKVLGIEEESDEAPAAVAAIQTALLAKHLLHRDVDYIIKEGRICVVDSFTGRTPRNREWPDGIQRFLEAKECLEIREEGRMLSSISIGSFLSMFQVLSGMSATLESSAGELYDIFGLDTWIIPPRLPSRRIDYPDMIFPTMKAKKEKMLNLVKDYLRNNSAVLIATASVKESEDISIILSNSNIEHQVLNAVQDHHEAELIAAAGAPGHVTVATNMAGRGTDIRLGGADGSRYEESRRSGGLHIISLNRCENQRIDRQLRGRAARQGDPGSSRFLLSLEDDFFIEYKIGEYLHLRAEDFSNSERLDDPHLTKEISHAQSVISSEHYHTRLALQQFTRFIDNRRLYILELRQAALFDSEFPELVLEHLESNINTGFEEENHQIHTSLLSRLFAQELDEFWAEYLAWAGEFQEAKFLQKLGGRDPYREFVRNGDILFEDGLKQLCTEVTDTYQKITDHREVERKMPDLERTWTYQMDDPESRQQGIVLTGMDTGSSAAAGMGIFLFLPFLLIRRLQLKLRRRRDARLRSETMR